MKKLDNILAELTGAERTAIEKLLGAGWRPMIEAYIERAIIEDFSIPTYRVGGTYAFILVMPNLSERREQAPKKRGRPPKADK